VTGLPVAWGKWGKVVVGDNSTDVVGGLGLGVRSFMGSNPKGIVHRTQECAQVPLIPPGVREGASCGRGEAGGTVA